MAPRGIEGDDSELLEFSKQALSRVSQIAVDLGARKKLCVAGCLAAELLIAKKALDAADANQLPRLQRRIPKLLEDLERVCAWPEPPDRDDPILKSVVRSKGTYITLQTAEDRVRRGLASFANVSPTVHEQYFRKLQRFSAATVKLSDGDGGAAKGKMETPDEYPPHVNSSLYSVLRSYSLCTCVSTRGPEQYRHHARLRLSDDPLKVDGCIAFDMLFSSSPTAWDHWQELQLRVSMKKARAKKMVKLKNTDEPTDGSSDGTVGDVKSVPVKPVKVRTVGGQPTRVIPQESFCGLVRKRVGSKICFHVQDSELHQLYDGFPMTCKIEPGPSISLHEAFETRRLSKRMKLVLAYIAARSFWQYYDSPWMETRWTSRSIHFLRESTDEDEEVDDEGGFYASRPCFTVEFEEHEWTKSVEYCGEYGVVFRCPRLLDLCVILLEIAQGKGIDIDDLGSMEANLNETWTKAKRLTKRSDIWGNFNFPEYRKAIFECLNFKPSSTNGEGIEKDVFARKAAIYNNVVLPLKKILDTTGFGKDLQIMGPMDASTREVKRVRELPAPPPLLPSQNDNAALAAQWITGLNDVNVFINSVSMTYKPQKRMYRPARVAILDTGYDPESIFLRSPMRKRRIRGWKDFVDGSNDPVDVNGHGTHCLSLAMKVAPVAEVYVARIAKDSSSLRYSADAIAEAIEWASTEVQADIISMSFGFQEHVPNIARAITKANFQRDDKILFFAAASNSGGNTKEMFPANMDGVISIRETNSNGAFSDTNPPVLIDGPAGLGTLGREVPSAWLSSVEGEVAKSGSSVSTAITAGIAAMVLTFVGKGLDSEATLPRELERVWTRRGMISVLKKMSQNVGNRSYFISPQAFFAGKDYFRVWMSMADACSE